MSSNHERWHDFDRRIGRRLASGVPVPLLVVEAPPERARSKTLADLATTGARKDDAIATTAGGRRLAVAMLSARRDGGAAHPPGIRRALSRVLAATGEPRARGGWELLRSPAEAAPLEDALDRALERGASEGDAAVLATVGHELRGPLTAIRGYVETLLDGPADAATARSFLETVRRETLRMGRLIDGMLEFSLLDLTSRGPAQCDAVAAVRAAVEIATPQADRRGVLLRMRGPESVRARVDGDACTRAVLNVVDNAVKSVERGGTVAIACSLESGSVRITVDDDGPGIPNVLCAAVFERGVRDPNAGYAGAGIGLAIVKAIVAQAGGSVRAGVSDLGGARIELRFLPA